MATFRAGDLGIDLDRMADRTGSSGFVLMSGCKPWSMSDHYQADLGMAVCPVCEGKPLARPAYCLACDRSYLDGRILYPGLAVNQAPDPDWAEANRHRKGA